jgi:hypothetical protein
MGPEPELSLADQAEFIVNNLQHTDYQYTENIDVDNGVYDYSQFANFVLSRTGAGPLRGACGRGGRAGAARL